MQNQPTANRADPGGSVVSEIHSGKSLISSAGWSLAGHVLPLGVALVAIPRLLHALGDERFGLLTLFWVLAGYFTVLDLGLGRALVLGFSRLRPILDRTEIGEAFWAGFALLGIVGTVLALGLQLGAGALVDLLGVSSRLRVEAIGAIRIVGWTMPATLLLPALVALPVAFQRQRGLTILRVPAGIASHLIPLLLVSWTLDLRHLMLANLGLRIVLLGVHFWYALRVHPLDLPRAGVSSTARLLIGTSLWMMLTNMVAPLLMNMDRLFISNGQGPGMLASYAPAMDFAQKLFTLFGVVMAVAFPAIGAFLADDPARSRSFYRQAISVLLLWTPPIMLFASAASYPAMRFWLGEAHGMVAGKIFSVLLIGCLAGLPGGISFGTVQASGGAKIASIFHLSQALLFAGLFWLGLHFGNLFVVAWIWSARHILDSLGMHVLACRRGAGTSPGKRIGAAFPSGILLMACVAILHSLHAWAGILAGLVFAVVWSGLLLGTPQGRESIPWSLRSMLSRRFAGASK